MAVILNASTSSGFIQTADTSGELNLQSNGSTKLSVLSTGVSGTLVQGTAVASTSGTSIDFTSIPSWVKRITVMFQGVSTSGTSDYLIRLGTSGGVVSSGYVASASTQNSGFQYVSLTSSVGLIFSNIGGGGGTASQLWSGLVIISLVSGNNWASFGNIINNVNGYPGTSAGSIALGGTLDRVRITTVNGTDTFDAGSINIQYEG
jgi:hypothetical protein